MNWAGEKTKKKKKEGSPEESLLSVDCPLLWSIRANGTHERSMGVIPMWSQQQWRDKREMLAAVPIIWFSLE
jgi:hypothetical protein